ncbi:hypothetical protein ABZW18_34020 [Streptomyces sp. NPDC004647]|uniref:hypothetical protein n=1 Tax=Streptomyces sp. NPDC004647 TaxID=3154671 RepID=UPI0033A7D373
MLTTTVCVALSAVGLAVAFLTAYRRRYLRATRIAAVALIPVGLAMAGLAELGEKVGRAVGDWGADLVFKPSVWAGFAVLATSAVLFVVARAAGRRGAGRTGSRAVDTVQRPAAAPGASAPSLGSGRRTAQPKPRAKAGSDDGTEDFEDIEEILKKHGI